jgi:hypothetical protein
VASVLVIEPVETAEEIREFISDRGDCVENVICDIDCFSDPVEGSHPLIVVNQRGEPRPKPGIGNAPKERAAREFLRSRDQGRAKQGDQGTRIVSTGLSRVSG